nr:hypothetical protein CFP56_00815 [Quercus suber]
MPTNHRRLILRHLFDLLHCKSTFVSRHDHSQPAVHSSSANIYHEVRDKNIVGSKHLHEVSIAKLPGHQSCCSFPTRLCGYPSTPNIDLVNHPSSPPPMAPTAPISRTRIPSSSPQSTPPVYVRPSLDAQTTDQPDTAPSPYVQARNNPAPLPADELPNPYDEPITLTVNVPYEIKGDLNVANVVPLVDATRYCTVLLTSIKQLVQQDGALARVPRPQINLVVNCGVSVVGDRNFIGAPVPRPQLVLATGVVNGERLQQAVPVLAGTKRSAQAYGQRSAPATKVRKTSRRSNSSEASVAVQEDEVKKEVD